MENVTGRPHGLRVFHERARVEIPQRDIRIVEEWQRRMSEVEKADENAAVLMQEVLGPDAQDMTAQGYVDIPSSVLDGALLRITADGDLEVRTTTGDGTTLWVTEPCIITNPGGDEEPTGDRVASLILLARHNEEQLWQAWEGVLKNTDPTVDVHTWWDRASRETLYEYRTSTMRTPQEEET